jgi:hypothetical protein
MVWQANRGAIALVSHSRTAPSAMMPVLTGIDAPRFDVEIFE